MYNILLLLIYSYHTDPATKERVKAASRDRYQTDSAVREKKKAQDRCNAQARKQILNDSRIYNFVDARSDDELNQKAQCMADELFDKMDPYINDEEGDLWYKGGACARRMTVDVTIDGRVTPRGAFSRSEIVNWFFRDNTTIRKKDGSKLTRNDVLALIESGELLIFVVDTDANPKVCDAAEELAQVRSIKKHPHSSLIRCVAAGSVARGSFVESDGYGLYGFVLKGAKNNTRFVVGTYSLRGMSLDGVRDTITLRKGNQNMTMSEILGEEHDNPTIVVRLQHLGTGAKRIYISEVHGSVHICTYGLPGKEDKWVVRVLAFGVGGELAAIASHNAILRKKLSKSYGERRGAYTRMGDQAFVGRGLSSNEQASEKAYLERIELSLTTNSILDEDVDDECDDDEDGNSSSKESDAFLSSEESDAKLSGSPQAIRREPSDYELYVQEKIARNKARLAMLGFHDEPKEKKTKAVKQRKSVESAPTRVLPGRKRKATTYNYDEWG